MEAKKLKDVKKGELFTRKPVEYPRESQVYERGEYDRSEKKYNCLKWCDYLGGGINLKGTTIVYVDINF